MSYEVGSHINLSNPSRVVIEAPKKSNARQVVSNLCEVGTQFMFNFTNQGVQVSRRIPVISV